VASAESFSKSENPEALRAWYARHLGIVSEGDNGTEGVWVDPKVEEYDYGKFGWIMDMDGNRIELWESLPKKSLP
jgi:hypothetical protein